MDLEKTFDRIQLKDITHYTTEKYLKTSLKRLKVFMRQIQGITKSGAE